MNEGGYASFPSWTSRVGASCEPHFVVWVCQSGAPAPKAGALPGCATPPTGLGSSGDRADADGLNGSSAVDADHLRSGLASP